MIFLFYLKLVYESSKKLLNLCLSIVQDCCFDIFEELSSRKFSKTSHTSYPLWLAKITSKNSSNKSCFIYFSLSVNRNDFSEWVVLMFLTCLIFHDTLLQIAKKIFMNLFFFFSTNKPTLLYLVMLFHYTILA